MLDYRIRFLGFSGAESIPIPCHSGKKRHMQSPTFLPMLNAREKNKAANHGVSPDVPEAEVDSVLVPQHGMEVGL